MIQRPESLPLLNRYRLAPRQAGFSLVELMVAMALSIFLIGGVTLTYLSGRATSVETEELSRMQENLRFAADFLVRDIRNAGFRDHLTLTFAQYEEIGKNFAEINSTGDSLTIRYAGRGSCGRAFSSDEEDLKLIENTYSVQGGRLLCAGVETVNVDSPGSPTPPVELATGIAGIEFEFVMPEGVAQPSVCNFFNVEDIATACIGVRITLEFEGEPNREAEITSAFRNVIFDKVYKRETI